jgi:hypothetical protein
VASSAPEKSRESVFFQKTSSEGVGRQKPYIETFGSDALGWASAEAESYTRGIGVDALTIDNCISMYHNFDGLPDGFIKCEFLEEPIPLPFELQGLVNDFRTPKKNNPKCRLVQYMPPLSDARDSLELTFCLTDYHTFLAINTRLDKEILQHNMTIRRRYWRDTFDLPRSPIPNMFYVHLLLISGDDKAIVLQRSQFVEEYKGMWSATLEEQMRPKQAGAGYDKDVFDTATRGVREEIGLEIERKDVTFLSLTFEYPNFNVGLAGVVRTQASAKEIWQTWHLKFEDQETSRFAAISFEPEVIIPLLREPVFNPVMMEDGHSNAMSWHPTARLRLLFALYHTYGLYKS